MIYQSSYRSDHLAEVVFVSFLHSKVILLLLLLLLIIIIIIIIIVSILYTDFHIIFCRRKLLCVFRK